MLDVIIFVLTSLVTFGFVVALCALVVATAVKPNKTMQAVFINNAVNAANDTLNVAASVPAEVARWAASNVAYATLFALCIWAHVSMNENEGQFLHHVNAMYKDINDVWTYAIVTPVTAFSGVLYGSLVPIFNFVVIPVQASFWGAVEALAECRDPLVFIRAVMSIPVAVGKFAAALVHVFDTEGGTTTWMVKPIDLVPMVQYVQQNVIQPMVDNADCLCNVMSPTFDTIGKIVTDSHVASAVHAAVNVVWRAIQTPVQFAAPQYHNFNVTPFFQELRDLGYHAGHVLDNCVEGYMVVATQNKDVLLPRPSIGMAAGRAWGGAWSLVEIPVGMIAAAVGHHSLYDAASAKIAFNHLYASVHALAGGMHAIGKFFISGSPGTTAVLTCNSYDYDFYKSHELLFPTECVCVPGTCGVGSCNADGNACECKNGAVHVVASDARSPCVLPCKDEFGSCNALPTNGTSYGMCVDGRCSCHHDATLDVRNGLCSPDTPPQFQNTSQTTCKITQTTGPPLACAVQTAGLAAIGLAYTTYSFAREILLKFPPQHSLWELMQNFDGMWYSRFDSVTCEYRKQRTDDFMIHTDNCQCRELDDDPRLQHFDPWCAQPTLNANFYNHLDGLAFYAGFWSERGFTGGMGTFSTFLSDSFGLAATNAARMLVEQARLATHVTAGFITYATTMASSLTSDVTGTPNLLQMPVNCEWGAEFDGPLRPKYWAYSPGSYEAEQRHFAQLDCLNAPAACSKTVRDIFHSWVPDKSNFDNLETAAQLKLLNDMNMAYEIYQRHRQNNCRDTKSHTWGTPLCEDTNDDASCHCNTELPWEHTHKCRCIAFYPSVIANKSKLYHMPWCNSMMLEWSYYRAIELSVAAENFLARLDSRNPIASKIDSPCFDGTTNYTLSQTHSVIKAFQPNNNEGFSFIGNKNTDLKNVNLCNSLAEADRNKPQWIQFEHGKAIYPAAQPPLRERQEAFRHVPSHLPTPNDPAWDAFRAKFPPPEGTNELTNKVYRLHPQTCAEVSQRDKFVFQPCAHTCITPGGNNRCWCDVVVSQDITCNVGLIIRQTTTTAVDQHRQLTGAILSVAGLIKGGMRINYAQSFCDLSRVIGSMSAAIASVLTGQLGGSIATSIRFRIATLLFTLFDTTMIMPLGTISGSMQENSEDDDELDNLEGENALESAALATMYQELFQDMFSGDSSSAVADLGQLAGALVANGMVIQIKFGCIAACNALDGVQKFIFAHDASAPGANIIPTIEDFIDVIIRVLDETYTNLVVMAANMVAGFAGLVTGGPPTIGEWLSNAFQVLEQIIEMINAPEHIMHFIGIMIALLPDSIQPIVKALMSTMCKGMLWPLNLGFDALNSIDILGFGFHVHNPFAELYRGCVDEGTVASPLHTSGDGNGGYARRLQESADYWEGHTFCAHYGRANHTHDELYDECVRNRVTVAKLRLATGRDYFPWTLMDDWKQPTLFVLQTLHGMAMYYGMGEARLRVWEQAGYPVEATMDIVHAVRSMKFPNASLHGLANLVPSIYPDYSTNNNSVGYHLMHVLHTLDQATFPAVTQLDWQPLHESAYDAVASVAAHSAITVATPHVHAAQRPRRLYESVLYQGPAAPTPAAHPKCNDDDSGVCIHCAFLQKFVTSFKLVSESTATYYTDVYPQQMQYLLDVLSYAQRPDSGANTSMFNFVATEQFAHNVKLPFAEPPANVTYQTHAVHTWPSSQDWKQFVIPHASINEDVPFFGHTMWYYLQYPLRPCKPWEMAYNSCNRPKYSVGDAAAMTVHVALATQILGWVTGLQVPLFIKLPLFGMSFMIFRYDYVPRCLPVLPWCLIIDLQHLITGVLPPHLCELVPALVTSSCSPGLEEQATYRSCPRNELGFLDPFFFLWRWKLPYLFTYAFGQADWGPAIGAYLQQIQQADDVTSLQTTCFYMAIFDVVIVAVAIVLGLRLAMPLLCATANSVVSAWGSIGISVPYLLNEDYSTDVHAREAPHS